MKTTRPEPATPSPAKRKRQRRGPESPESASERDARDEAARSHEGGGDKSPTNDVEAPIADELRQHPGS